MRKDYDWRHLMEKKSSHPPFEKVAGAYIDHEIERLVIVTKDILQNQLQRDCPKIAVSFDQWLKDDLEQASELIASVFTIILPRLLGRDLSDEGRGATCARLLHTATTTLIGCIHLARGGFRLQYSTLSRSVVETICTVLHLMVSPDALRDFHLGKLKSTQSLTYADKVLPGFGKIWGFLSDQFVHISTMHSTVEPISAYKEGDQALSYIRSNMKALAWLLYVAAELVSIETIEHPRCWKIINRHDHGNEIVFDPSEEEWARGAAFLGMDVRS